MTFLQLSMIWPYSGLFGLYDFENGKRWCHMNFYFQIMLKSPINYENLGFSTSGLSLAFNFFFGLFSIFLVFRCVEYSKSFKFELFRSNFAIKTVFAENLANWISVYCQSVENSFSLVRKVYIIFKVITMICGVPACEANNKAATYK